MSDVEQAISGDNGEKTKSNSQSTTATTTTNTSPTAAALKQKNQQQQQQHHQPQKQHHQQQHQQQHHQHQYYSNKFGAATNALTGSATLTPATTSTGFPTTTADTLTANCCVSRTLKIIFSTPGLVVLVIFYSVMGALIFPLLEAPQDITKSTAIAKSREDCLRELWIITEKLNVLYERNWTMLVHEQLRRFEGTIVAATRNGGVGISAATGLGGGTGGTKATALGYFGGNLDAFEQARWSFSEALLYSVTVITTIGHGSLTPKTAAGKIATILYALIGVPLMLMCLSSLGALLAEALQCTYARICCRLSRNSVINSIKNGGTGGGGGRAGGKRQRRCSGDSLDERSSYDGVLKQCENDSECQGKTHAGNCRSCKYDAIMGETQLNNSYEFGGNGGNKTARNEESCQLLHNNSPCMQLKTGTTTMAANAQYYQRMAGTHMPLQQCADVLTSTPTTAATATTMQVPQKFSHQPQCSHSATPSPQHFQHPLQTYHIVPSVSTNSSPTHQTLRQYVTTQTPTSTNPPPATPPQPQQQQHQPHQQNQPQQQQQQHFVAVPSGLIRFQATPSSNYSTAGGGDIVSSMPTHCYQPASVAVTGSTTIYFPIAVSTAIATSTKQPTVAPTQLLCNQPLVKYHTIQLQHKKPYLADVATGQHVDLSTTCTLPLPPPAAYQTATVHGVRRAKFLTKPLPHEINALLAENDVSSCRHDLLQNTNTIAATRTTTIPTSTALLSTGITATAATMATTTATPSANTLTHADKGGIDARTAGGAAVAATPAGSNLGSSATVDIMEDEEEHEQQRIGNCPHGTPSRVPLISDSNKGGAHATLSDCCKDAEKSTSRSLLNATAASFHRHTLHTFQRNGSRKSTLVARRRCSRHALAHSRSTGGGSVSGCYGDTTETSDEDDYLQNGSEEFVLEQIDTDGDANNDDDDNDNDEDDEDVDAHSPQVPISVVLLILVCYICLGTVIFAVWENWSLIDGAYFCFVTLATIGYGDFLPEQTFRGPEVQLFACCVYLLLGLVLVAMSFSILETQLMWKCKRIAVRLKLAKD